MTVPAAPVPAHHAALTATVQAYHAAYRAAAQAAAYQVEVQALPVA